MRVKPEMDVQQQLLEALVHVDEPAHREAIQSLVKRLDAPHDDPHAHLLVDAATEWLEYVGLKLRRRRRRQRKRRSPRRGRSRSRSRSRSKTKSPKKKGGKGKNKSQRADSGGIQVPKVPSKSSTGSGGGSGSSWAKPVPASDTPPSETTHYAYTPPHEAEPHTYTPPHEAQPHTYTPPTHSTYSSSGGGGTGFTESGGYTVTEGPGSTSITGTKTYTHDVTSTTLLE